MKGAALVVMARAPEPGQVKTRLQPELTAGQCAAIYRAFLRDTVSLVVSLPQYTPFLAFTPGKSRAVFEEFTMKQRIELIPQSGRSLGQRMYRVMRHLQDLDYSPVVLIGSDIPTLQPATLIRAFNELTACDICLGPSSDGGYYLIGARHIDESIFRGIRWSTSQVLETTMRRAEAEGETLALLEEYSDIDTFADLHLLNSKIYQLSKTPGAVVPLHTKVWIEETALSFAMAAFQ